MTFEEDLRTLDLGAHSPPDQLFLPSIIVDYAIIESQSWTDNTGQSRMVHVCKSCAAMVYPMGVDKHREWHKAIADSFQQQKSTNQSFAVANSASVMLLNAIRSLLRPLVTPPDPEPIRTKKRVPKPTKKV